MAVQSGTNPADLSGLSGKELARARRAQLAKQGKNALAKGSQSAQRTRSQAASSMTRQQAAPEPAAPQHDASVEQVCHVAESNPASFGQESNRVRAICRARRKALAEQGRSAMPPKPKSQGGPGRYETPYVANEKAAVIDHADENPAQQSTGASNQDTQMETLCSVAEVAPGRLGKQAKTVRDICRARRQALADRGKKAVPPKPASQGGPGRNGYQIDGYLDTSLSGREAAKRHREMLCHYGRGSSPSCRPTGRAKKNGEADMPKKVETGHTLSGKSISGTQVDRKDRVTGNEPGTCRTVTGTEYVGTEQFTSFCKTRPEPGQSKVHVTSTARGHQVSGTDVMRSKQITGEEEGTCANITGTEYLSSESLKSFCGTRARPTHADKVNVGESQGHHLKITGSDEFRPNRATGTESGAKRTITGSQYSDAGVARLTINGAPAKVPMTHTFAGHEVSGTEVGHSKRITGDESGACRNISGTEYLSNEQFQSFCSSRPVAGPEKVGIDNSAHGQRITGNLVDRSERVTGNEPGSCNRVTGSQYSQNRLCGGGTDKVRTMHTLSGHNLTGQQIDHSPKMSGDEQGGCMPVTGTEYYGQEHFAPYCESTPNARAAKVAESMTCDGQRISGPAMDVTDTVTGNEYGATLHVSGTPYGDAGQAGCAMPPSHRFGQNMAERFSNRYVGGAAAPQQPEPMMQTEPNPADFSIVPPARAAQSRITGNAVDQGSRITGPSNMAMGLITGTPEFRHGEQQLRSAPRMGSVMPTATAAAPVQSAPVEQQAPVQTVAPQAETPAAAPEEATLQCAPEPQSRERITGEGEDRCRITGDDWSRNERVTGTEGKWAQGRNPSLRGQARGEVRNAWVNREVPRPDVPPSKITGSSGNDTSGSLITYSGGARG